MKRFNLASNVWQPPSRELTPDVKTAIALLVKGAAEAHPATFRGLSEDNFKLTPRNLKAMAILVNTAQKLFEKTRDQKWIRVRRALGGIGYATK